MTRPIELLLVEDNEGDANLTLEAFNRARVHNRVHIAADGIEAMEFLRKEGPHKDATRPDLILLDLNLPRMDGREVLEALKADADLSLIPVVVLTTSQAEEDILKSYRLKANCYVTKPVDLQQFLSVIKTLGEFWLQVVKLPPQSEA